MESKLSESREYWRAWRKEMLLEPDKIQLNNGSFGPLPRPVADRLYQLLAQVARGPSDFYWRRQPGLLDAARASLARFLNADPLNLLLTFNTTGGVNMVASSLELPAGSEILMTDQEYGACRYCWQEYAARRGWTIRIAPIPIMPQSGSEIVESIAESIRSETKVLFFSHVTSPTGLVLPAAALCRLAREHGLYSVIDGAHAPGMVDVDVAAVDADFYAGNCHKWLLAPSGSAFLYVNPAYKAMLKPLVISWGWDSPRDRPDIDSGWGGTHWQRYLEFQGTIDRCPQMTIPDAIAFRERIGSATIDRRIRCLAEYLRSGMAQLGYELATPEQRDLSGSLTAFVVPTVDVVKARNWIWSQHDVEAPFTQSADQCYVRVSTAWFTDESDLDKFLAAMRSFDPVSLAP